MKLSCFPAVLLALVGMGTGATCALALDAPHTLHHSRPTAQHLAASNHSRAHHTSTHRAASATTHTGARTTRVHHYATSSSHSAATLRRTSLHVRRHRYYERFTASSFAGSDLLASDVTTGEDPVVRQAAIDALGDMNGTALVINPANGRILAMVNQKLALSPGAEPCSTIKITVAMAALSEGLVTRDTMVQLPGFRMNMTEALAHSNNLYFEELGRELGFDRVRNYANKFGLGELAGYNIPGEQLGVYPDQPLPASEGGVGRMCSFGQGVSMTPLATGRLRGRPRQRWNSLLSAASYNAGRSCELRAQGQADPRYRKVHS